MAFRTGIYKMFTSDRPMMETAGVAMVANITGDVNEKLVSAKRPA